MCGKLQAYSISSEEKRVLMAFEDETTITQKPYIRKSFSFKGKQQKIEHNGSRKKFSMYISMMWPDTRLTYDFYGKMNSTNTIIHLTNLKKYVVKNSWKRLILIWDNASFHVSKEVQDYINTQKEWLTTICLPKKAPYLNPNERKVNQQIKSDVCTNKFYKYIEEQKAVISEYLDKRFGTWDNDIIYDT
jgi:hypothetical protein